MKKILLYMENNYPNIPINDKDAYQQFIKYSEVYNKLLISQLQKLDCSPSGIIPNEYPVIVKPIINLYGMSNGYLKIDNYDDFIKNRYIGMFWQKYLDGIQYNVDINMINGKIFQYFCVVSEPDKLGMFKYHKYIDNYDLPEKVINFLQNVMFDYSGFINIEIINEYIIEMHLRLNGDLFLYSEQNIDDMINYKKIKVDSTCFFPIFVNKYLNININKFLDSLNIDYDIDGTICNDFKRLLYFRHSNFEEGIQIQNKIYEYVNKYNTQEYNPKYFKLIC
tara:strand:- start:10665 stop:11501 length:837 start_codon:yes stop_codon:yes gene_type:complete